MKNSLLTFVLLSLVAMPFKASAAEFSVLVAAAEEGDDRLRPAVGLHGGFAGDFFARTWIYGRTFGPVTEKTVIVGGSKRWSVFGSKAVSAGFGLSGMLEKTSIQYSDAPDEDVEENRYNFGAILGIHYQKELFSSVVVSASWESHVFAAGSGILFLSTARKQILAVGMGVTIK